MHCLHPHATQTGATCNTDGTLWAPRPRAPRARPVRDPYGDAAGDRPPVWAAPHLGPGHRRCPSPQVKELGTVIYNCSRLARDLEKTFQTYWVLGAPKAVLPKHWPQNFSSHINRFQPLCARFDGVPTTAYFSVSGHRSAHGSSGRQPRASTLAGHGVGRRGRPSSRAGCGPHRPQERRAARGFLGGLQAQCQGRARSSTGAREAVRGQRILRPHHSAGEEGSRECWPCPRQAPFPPVQPSRHLAGLGPKPGFRAGMRPRAPGADGQPCLAQGLPF